MVLWAGRDHAVFAARHSIDVEALRENEWSTYSNTAMRRKPKLERRTRVFHFRASTTTALRGRRTHAAAHHQNTANAKRAN